MPEMDVSICFVLLRFYGEKRKNVVPWATPLAAFRIECKSLSSKYSAGARVIANNSKPNKCTATHTLFVSTECLLNIIKYYTLDRVRFHFLAPCRNMFARIERRLLLLLWWEEAYSHIQFENSRYKECWCIHTNANTSLTPSKYAWNILLKR